MAIIDAQCVEAPRSIGEKSMPGWQQRVRVARSSSLFNIRKGLGAVKDATKRFARRHTFVTTVVITILCCAASYLLTKFIAVPIIVLLASLGGVGSLLALLFFALWLVAVYVGAFVGSGVLMRWLWTD